jgi:hypothetical protein
MENKEKPSNIWERFETIPRQAFYIILLGLMVFAFLFPMGLPIRLGETSKSFYQEIENVPDGSVIIVDISYGPSMAAEFTPQAIAFLHHVFSREIKVLLTSFEPQGPMTVQGIIDEINPETRYNKKYGEDWMYYGFRAGGGVAIAELAKDLHFFNDDYLGAPLSELPIMQGLTDHNDIYMIISVASSSGTSGTELWVQQWAVPYKTKLLSVIFKMMIPRFMPYIQAGQISSYMGGIDAAASYELLINIPGKGLSYTDALTYSQLMIIVLILIGNIGYLMQRTGEEDSS